MNFAQEMTADPSAQVANSLAALSVSLSWGAIILAVILTLAAFGYGAFLRGWIKTEAREGAREYLRSAEGQIALSKMLDANAVSASAAALPPPGRPAAA